MNFWEQFVLGFALSLLHGLKVDPARVPVLRNVLLDIYDGIGEVLGLPPRSAVQAPSTTASILP